MRVLDMHHIFAAAYHEAGHAVTAHTIGIDVRHMSLIPDPKRRYDAFVNVENIFLTNLNIENSVVLYLAGPVAESIAMNKSLQCLYGIEDDLFKARGLLEYALPSEKEMNIASQLLLETTSDIIMNNNNWKAIERLAEEAIARFFWAGYGSHKRKDGKQLELFDNELFRPTMNGDDIVRCIEQADRNRTESKLAHYRHYWLRKNRKQLFHKSSQKHQEDNSSDKEKKSSQAQSDLFATLKTLRQTVGSPKTLGSYLVFKSRLRRDFAITNYRFSL